MTISQTCLLTIILFLSFSLTAQNKSQTNNSINIVLGKQITNTYKITDIFNVVEGFAPDAQESRNGNKISFSYHRRFNKIGYLGLRFGYDEIIVNSIGLKGGIGPPRLYNLDFKFPFLSFGLSHFKIMKLNRNNFLKLSNSISIEEYIPAFSFKALNYLQDIHQFEGLKFRYRLKIAYGHKLTKRLNLIMGLMFSTAINDYVKGFRRFEPYAFGIFLGADYNF